MFFKLENSHTNTQSKIPLSPTTTTFHSKTNQPNLLSKPTSPALRHLLLLRTQIFNPV
jgi:hypothetical protein